MNSSSENGKSSKDSQQTVAEQKGREFEEYVIDHFNKKYFALKEWRGDKIHAGRYAESNRYPDMEWEFTLNGKANRFAVECKWRTAFYNDWVEWASEEQADIYRQFEKEENIPVVVVIGIGGTPSAPEKVYCVPLKVLKLNRAKESYIHQYAREDVSKMFFYDMENHILK